MLKFLILSLSLAFGQDNGIVQSVNDFTGGLNTWKAPVLLSDNESPRLQNVILDKSFGVTKRKGYNKRNTTAIGDGSTRVDSVYQLETSGGTRYCVAFSSTNGYSGTNACQTFSSFVSTLTRNNNVNCEGFQDRLYCVNNQYNFYFDGTNDYPISTLPANSDFIRVHRNRCFAAGNSTNPSRLFWSNLSDCATWTTASDWVDVQPEDGDVITAIGPPIFDMLPIYKKFSTWALKGTGPNSFVVVNISRNIGAKNHRSIANFKNVQLFDSVGPNGGQPGIYAFNGIVVEEASKKLRNEIDNLDTFKANSGRYLIDTKDDFDSGNFDPYSMSSSRESGFMQSSYTAFSDTAGSDWASGTFVDVDTTSLPGFLIPAKSTVTAVVWEQYEDGDVSASPPWTAEDGCTHTVTSFNGSNAAYSTCFGQNYIGYMTTPATATYGVWQFDIAEQGSGTSANSGVPPAWDFCFVYGGSVTYCLAIYGQTDGKFKASIMKNGSAIASTAEGAITINEDTRYTVKIVKTSTGSIQCALAGTQFLTAQDNAATTSTKLRLGIKANTVGIFYNVDNIYIPGHMLAGTVTSRIWDTYISTPTWGSFDAIVSSGAGSGSGAMSTLTFQVQASTASDGGGFEALVSQTNNWVSSAAKRRYHRYVGTFGANAISTATARLFSVDISAASTGTWTSPELFLSNNISAGGWGLFQTDQTTTGNGTLVYAIRASTYSGGTANAVWSAISANASISISTGAYFQVMSTNTVTAASETARFNSLNINWAEGSQAISGTGAVFNGRYHYGAQSFNGSQNDVMYVLDDNGAWTKWTGVQPAFLNVVNQNFVMAGSSTSSGGFIYKLYEGDSDDNGAIQAIYETKDFVGKSIQNIKAVDRIYVVHASSNTTLTTDLLANGGLTSKSYSVNLSTGTSYAVKPIVVTPYVIGNTFRIRISNNAASKPWEIYGLGIFYRDLGLMP